MKMENLKSVYLKIVQIMFKTEIDLLKMTFYSAVNE